MTLILEFTPPPTAPLWTADTVSIPKMFGAAAEKFTGRAKVPAGKPARESFVSMLIGAYIAVEVAIRRAFRKARKWAAAHAPNWLFFLGQRIANAVPVVTTRGRYQTKLDCSHTDGALWGMRHAQEKATRDWCDDHMSQPDVRAAAIAAWAGLNKKAELARAALAGRDEQMGRLRWELEHRGPDAVVEFVRDWTTIGGAGR